MKKNSIPIIIVILAGIVALNLMCLILRVAGMYRITCGSLERTFMQNKINAIAIVISLAGIYILRKFQKKHKSDRNDTDGMSLKED